MSEVLSESISHDSSSQDEAYTPAPSAAPSSSRRDNITLSLSSTELFRQSSDVAARMHLTTRQHAAMTASFVKMGGGSLVDASLSVSTSSS